MICPKCGKEMPNITVCWYCGELLDSRLREIMKNSPDEPKARRNSTFLNRGQKTPKRRKRK